MKKKAVISLLTLVTSLSLTACSLQFKTSEQSTQVPDIINTINVDLAQEFSNIVDETDFNNPEDVEQMASDIVSWAQNYVAESDTLESFQKATLVRVVDGDTIVVNIEGDEYTVRLIGINTPESVAPEGYRTENSEEGVLASEYVKNMLANVETVYLQKDISETDMYDRLLRYVWLEIPADENDINEISTKMLNGILLKEGVAEVTIYEPDTAHEEDFEWIYDNM